MAFISISITKNHPLILGKGGFGRQLADWWAACVTTPTLSC